MPDNANQVLAGQVDTCLATYRRVDSPEQCCWKVHDFHSPEPCAGNISGEVGHRASTDTRDGVIPIEPKPSKVLINRHGDFESFCLIPVGKTDHFADQAVSFKSSGYL